jgi:tRNA threonylcarbamoyladenosine biosynthesis protein TsaB
MRILLIHTAGNEGSVALADTASPDAIVATEILPGRTSSEKLVPAIRGLLGVRGWKLGELSAVVVVHGPGSFTGVRVGLSAAKGLSEAANVPLIAVSRLALLAASVDGGGAPVHAVLDAGRGQYYYGEYAERRCVREALLSLQALMEAAVPGTVVICEAKVAESLAGISIHRTDEPLAGDALPFALDRIAAGDFEDAATLDANYLRRTDLEIFAKPALRAE